MTDADWPAAGSPGWWVNDGGTIRKPTQAEKDQRVVDTDAAALAAAESVLYYACIAYQNDRMDTNTANEATKSEALVESGIAEATDLPKAQAVGDWIESLWEEYFSRKVDALTASIDFTGFDPTPYTCIEIRTERKDFLAAQP